jgi:hypothetical protein
MKMTTICAVAICGVALSALPSLGDATQSTKPAPVQPSMACRVETKQVSSEGQTSPLLRVTVPVPKGHTLTGGGCWAETKGHEAYFIGGSAPEDNGSGWTCQTATPKASTGIVIDLYAKAVGCQIVK